MSAMLHVRMDEKMKADGLAALDAMGLTASDAVRLLFHRIVADQAFPLELKVPNAETRAAMAESKAIMREAKHTGQGRFAVPEEVFNALEKASGE
jgi:DNA-damage-inducible protein J